MSILAEWHFLLASRTRYLKSCVSLDSLLLDMSREAVEAPDQRTQ